MLTPPLPPLVLDLDGTLTRTDTFHEMMVHLLTRKPWTLLLIPLWLLKGRAFAKARLGEEAQLSLVNLPYNAELLAFAQGEAQKGRTLILATGADQKIADKIANHLGIFQEAIGSQGNINMTGSKKCHALLERFGPNGFDYAGDSRIDIHIWKASRKALVVHPKWGVLKRAHALKGDNHTHHFPREKNRLLALSLVFRPFFWIANALAPTWALFWTLNLLSSGLLIGGDLVALQKERENKVLQSIFAEGSLHLSTALLLSFLCILPPMGFLVFTTPWGGAFSLVYIPLFILLDLLTRFFSPPFRWGILGCFQLSAVYVLGTL